MATPNFFKSLFGKKKAAEEVTQLVAAGSKRAKERSIRLFLSSTFRDMNEERDYLITHVFNRIKGYCTVRHIDFKVVDLRWGITEEQSRNGLVLASCMEEVDNSRPFFVGILGSRYGWMPTAEELKNSRPVITGNRQWIEEKLRQRSSITEIEIEYAAFTKNSIANAAFFIRSEEIEVPVDFREARGSLAEAKLAALKRKLREQQRFPTFTYSSAKELGEILYQRLMDLIKREYPDEANDYLNSVQSRHEASLERRAFTLFELPNVKDFTERWKSDGCPPLLITGPSGTGTSNNLANTTQFLRAQNPGKTILYYDFEMADPDKDLMDDFYDFLELNKELIKGESQWCCLSIDNANILDNEHIDRMMSFIRDKQTAMHIIVAASQSYFADTMLILGYPNIKMEGLSHELQFEFIRNYAALYGKQLTQTQQEMIVRGKHSNDPLVLALLLNSLVNFGSMEKLDARIAELVKNADYSIFAGFAYEYDKIFGKELGYAFAGGMITIAMHSHSGISEENLANALDISDGDWAIVRPAVLQFCHGNTKALTFKRNGWNQDIKNHYSTPWMCSLGCRMIDWWMSRMDLGVQRASSSIFSIYLFIWHLPFPDDDTFKRIKDNIVRLLLSPEVVEKVPLYLLSAVWHYFQTSFSTRVADVIGKPMSQLTMDQKQVYYSKLLRIAETSSRYADMEWCLERLTELYADTPRGCLYKAQSLLAVQRAHGAIAEASSVDDSSCSTSEYIYKHSILTKALTIIGKYEEAVAESICNIDFCEKEDVDAEDAIQSLKNIVELCSIVILVSNFEDAKVFVQMMVDLGESEIIKRCSITNPIWFYYYLGIAHYFLRTGDWEQMFKYARHSYISAGACFGTTGYHFGRSHILVNFAYLKWKGEYYVNATARTHSFRAYTYLRPLQDTADKEVRKTFEAHDNMYNRLIEEMERIK